MPAWKRLGLEPDERADCCRTSRELALVDPRAPSPEQVAVEFALTKAFDVEMLLASPNVRRDRPPMIPRQA